MKYLLSVGTLAAAVLACAPARSQSIESLVNIRLQPDARVFAVMAAANAAGFDIDSGDLAQNPARKLVRERLTGLNPELLARIRAFFAALAPEDDSIRQVRLISYALLLGRPPEFSVTLKSAEWPEDARPLAGLDELIRAMWQQPEVPKLWEEVRPRYVSQIEEYRPLIRSTIIQVLAYFRSPPRVSLDRQVVFIPDLLNAFGMANGRNIEDSYVLVVGPSRAKDNKLLRGLRHEYLHFLLDPIVRKYREYLPESEPFVKAVVRLPKSRQEYANDFVRMAGESLVQAVEIRLDAKAGGQSDPRAVVSAYDQGLMLLPYFDEALHKFEGTGQSLQELFPGLLEQIRWETESKRTSAIDRMRSAVLNEPPAAVVQNPAGPAAEIKTLLAGANAFLQQRNFEQARKDLEKVLALDSGNASALFGMGQIASHEEAYERALGYYEKAIAAAGAEKWIAAWSLVHRGNIYMIAGERDRARAEWSLVLQMEGDLRGAADTARSALAREKP